MATRFAEIAFETPVAAVPRPALGYALAVIVPTYEEADNVARIVASLDSALAGIRFEIVFVDDLPHTATGKILKTELRTQYKDYKLASAA